MLDALELIDQETGGGLDIVREESQRGDARDTAADISRARSDLDYHPKWDVERGLREQVAWHRSRVHA
jgi:nucleoside-diphosphate-sugar epimerase